MPGGVRRGMLGGGVAPVWSPPVVVAPAGVSVAGPPNAHSHPPLRRSIGLILGVVGSALVLALPAPEGMPEAARRTAAAVLMAVWWGSEAIPIPATTLLPLVLFPALGIAPIGEAARPFANPLIFLFLGGFILALTV